jgi:hypothetical protein
LDSSPQLLLRKETRWIPASAEETLDSSLHNNHTAGMKPYDLKSNLTVQFIMYCTIEHATCMPPFLRV